MFFWLSNSFFESKKNILNKKVLNSRPYFKQFPYIIHLIQYYCEMSNTVFALQTRNKDGKQFS